jgi:tRNA A-37 threonylcarbamoyl transferase component Bud32
MKNENPINEKSALLRISSRVILSLAATLYRPVALALLFLLLLLIVLFSLQFAPQDGWGTVPAIIDLHRYCDPPINAVAGCLGMNWPACSPSPESQLQSSIAAWLGLDWSERPISFLPLVLCFAIIFFLFSMNRIAKTLQEPMQRLLQKNVTKRDLKTLSPESATPPMEISPPQEKRTIPKPETKSMPPENMVTIITNSKSEGQHIGRYEILKTLGQGAMGVVYKARDPQIGRAVAIKSISAAAPSSPEFKIYKQRFMQEAKAAGQMAHPGIVTIFDLTEDKDGHPAMVMEFVEGVTLEKIMSDERPPFKRCVNLLAQAAHALEYAHQRGVIHRDIKPANLLVTGNDVLKIADFGIAKLSGASLTMTGQLLGTPAFMSPEQFTGSSVDGRSDLFSLGAILYWMCTGEFPFTGESVTSIGIKVMQVEPVSALQLNPSLPPDIELVLTRCLAKNPDKRYATATYLAADLEALGSGQPLPSESKKGG